MTGIYTAGALEQLEKNADRSDPALFFSDTLDPVGLRDLVNECTKAYGGMVCAFLGNDESGYRYIFAVCPENADKTDIRHEAKEFNNRCSGKGGGSGIMVQGTSTAKRDEIESFFNVWINCNN